MSARVFHGIDKASRHNEMRGARNTPDGMRYCLGCGAIKASHFSMRFPRLSLFIYFFRSM